MENFIYNPNTQMLENDTANPTNSFGNSSGISSIVLLLNEVENMKKCKWCEEELIEMKKQYHNNCLKEKNRISQKKYSNSEIGKKNKKKYQKENRKRIKETNRRWGITNKDKLRISRKKWVIKNLEKSKEIGKKWKKNNPEKVKKWNETNKDKIKTYHQKERINHREKINARVMAHKNIKIPESQLCQRCNKEVAKEKHHRDYSKPLEVKFLCRKCHKIEDGEEIECSADLKKKYGDE